MSFVRENTYKLLVERDEKDSRATKTLCMNFSSSRGAPIVTAWIESYYPPRWLDGGGLQEERTDTTVRLYVYGGDVLDKKRLTNDDMATFQMALALGRDNVLGEDALSMVHWVLSSWFVRGPKHARDVLAKAAPRWWKLVDPKREKA